MFIQEFSVQSEWVDRNKHMGDIYYVTLLMEEGNRIGKIINIDEEDLHPKGLTTFTGDFHITYVKELILSDKFRVETRIAEYDSKRFTMHHEIIDDDEALCATASRLLLSISWQERRVAPFDEEALSTLKKYVAAQESASAPKNFGRTAIISAGAPQR